VFFHEHTSFPGPVAGQYDRRRLLQQMRLIYWRSRKKDLWGLTRGNYSGHRRCQPWAGGTLLSLGAESCIAIYPAFGPTSTQ